MTPHQLEMELIAECLGEKKVAGFQVFRLSGSSIDPVSGEFLELSLAEIEERVRGIKAYVELRE